MSSLGKGIAAMAVAVSMFVGLAFLGVMVVVAGGGAAVVAVSQIAKGQAATIPLAWRPALQAADQVCNLGALPARSGTTPSNLPTWAVLAGIGAQESDFAPSGSVDRSSASAIGPMQFEAATFVGYVGEVAAFAAAHPSLHMPLPPVATSIRDSVIAAGFKLCTTAAPNIYERATAYNTGSPGGKGARCAIHVSPQIIAHYGGCVLADAAAYAKQTRAWVNPASLTPAGTGVQAVLDAADQLGVGYVWAGATPGKAFDCSGLTAWVWGKAGVTFPHNAQAQYDQLAASGKVASVPGPAVLTAGELLFFGSSTTTIGHVGIYAGHTGHGPSLVNWMIDAPAPGSVVRYDAIPAAIGAHWGTDLLIATGTP